MVQLISALVGGKEKTVVFGEPALGKKGIGRRVAQLLRISSRELLAIDVEDAARIRRYEKSTFVVSGFWK